MANIQRRGEGSWFLTVNVGKDTNGKYTRRTKTVHCRTKKEAENEYAKFRQEVLAGEYIAPEKMTFAAFVDEWKDKYANKQLERKTMYSYNTYLDNHILPTFGHMRLDQIKPLHIVDYLENLSKDGGRQDGKEGGLSSGTIQFHHRIIKNIFTRAVEWRVIKLNPAASVKRPKVVHKEVIPYDENEVEALLLSLQKEPIHWRIMVTLAITTGLGRGELLGLEWKHIDWKNGLIDVVQSLSISLKGEVIVKEPKTKNSKRKVALPASMLDELREYYTYRVIERDQIGDAWQGGEHFFVFSHPDGKAFHQERPYLWFREFIRKYKFRYIRFHDLRHTSATLLINQGVHAKIISERLGHGSITTTMNIYGHALRSADQAAADKFENLLSFKAKKQG